MIHYFSNFYIKSFTQNISALFDLILIFGSIEIFIKIIKKKFNFDFLNLFIISLVLILFNPMIMNVYSFSSYEDFHVAYVLLVIFYYNYENNFDLIKILEKKNYLYFTFIFIVGFKIYRFYSCWNNTFIKLNYLFIFQ